MLKAGELTERITIEKRGGGVNENGEPLPGDWVEHASVWANVRFLSGKEYVVSGAIHSSAIASMRIRFRRDVDSEMRIRHDGRLYDIAAVLPNRRHGYVDLSVKVGEKYV
ncbi:phage head-tail adaptor [Burkholderia pseudomallei]|uniref:phage head closure protein n=1 Tax=Burkholderia pseudomallei TaxID=28450 RepID=UPI0005724166|nr:phage head closure protein [Burkholderia pseudomallei]KIX62157.1 head-tail adaptor protein [Burkholderia pseudomallei]MBF3456834.1 phage head closure protein [Burkholderia pseudomallei]MBF3480815.1 phage head closure protein [Burkholderia pseudomallei]MBF3511137.1 phage head closure protein [Burkholderia pseudomallei]MBF3517438.1 phage head closure protein [Burkholderia pseudomallei]